MKKQGKHKKVKKVKQKWVPAWLQKNAKSPNAFHQTSEELPPIILDCLHFLESHHAEQSEGLFRISGDFNLTNRVYKLYEKGKTVDLEKEVGDKEHVVAGILKKYIRELPIPLLTFEYYNCFMAVMDIENEKERIDPIRTAVNLLPPANKKTLTMLLAFLKKVSQNSAVNKMTTENLALVFSPSILRPPGDSEDVLSATLMMGGKAAALVSLLIDRYEDLFLKKITMEGSMRVLRKNTQAHQRFYATLKEGTKHLTTTLRKEKEVLKMLKEGKDIDEVANAVEATTTDDTTDEEASENDVTLVANNMKKKKIQSRATSQLLNPTFFQPKAGESHISPEIERKGPTTTRFDSLPLPRRHTTPPSVMQLLSTSEAANATSAQPRPLYSSASSPSLAVGQLTGQVLSSPPALRHSAPETTESRVSGSMSTKENETEETKENKEDVKQEEEAEKEEVEEEIDPEEEQRQKEEKERQRLIRQRLAETEWTSDESESETEEEESKKQAKNDSSDEDEETSSEEESWSEDDSDEEAWMRNISSGSLADIEQLINSKRRSNAKKLREQRIANAMAILKPKTKKTSSS
ncbi:N-chimaerin [Balamuthia mandrillaris]